MIKTLFNRRNLLAGIVGSLVPAPAFAREEFSEIDKLRPGQYAWHPRRAPAGPVAAVVSIPQQRVHVYRNGLRIGVSTCSTGKSGHMTPTGVFVILEKDKHHKSSTYNDAPMPNMHRLTWSGIALHAGNLPGYSASHGCVRLPMRFSEKLWGVTHLGTPVIIAGDKNDPWHLTHPGMVMSAYAGNQFEKVLSGLDGKKRPTDWANSESRPVVSVIGSASDRTIELIENNEVIARSLLNVKGDGPLGSHVLVLGENKATGGLRWIALYHAVDEPSAINHAAEVMSRLSAEEAFIAKMNEKMRQGMTLVLTDAPLAADDRSGKVFVIVTSD
jgi:hypothetical protein